MAHCVLVAGEHWKLATGERNMGTNHCSLEHVGFAFDRLTALGVPRRRIIVIAQLAERREWLRKAAASGRPCCTSSASASAEPDEAGLELSRRIYAQKLATLEESCAGIIRSGGADYDFDAVNPETVVRVLTGALDAQPAEQAAAGPVVPRDCAGTFLGIYSHGCSHETADLDGDHWRRLMATIPYDVCGKPHPLPPPATDGAGAAEGKREGEPDHEHISLRTNEWYIHMPHSAPSAVTGAPESATPMFDGIAHAQHEHPYSLLYWQILFRCYHRRFAQAPHVPMLVLLNSCRSGGMAKFLEQPIADKYYRCKDWPLYVMSSSQAERDAVVGGLWTNWFKALASDGDVSRGESFEQFFERIRQDYNRSTNYDITNRLAASWQPSTEEGARTFVADLRACLASGAVDNGALTQLIKRHGVQPRLNCIMCESFGRAKAGGAGGGLLCSQCERTWSEDHSSPPPAPPATAPGSDANVAALLESAKKAESQVARPWAWCGTRSAIANADLRGFLLSDHRPPLLSVGVPAAANGDAKRRRVGNSSKGE